MKREVRVLGVDDAPFAFEDDRVEIVGVVVRVPAYVEGVLVSDVAVDGTDATERLATMIAESRFHETLSLVLVDGVALGGFNVVDLAALRDATGIPVATVTKKEPDPEAIERALRAKFADWERRLALIQRFPLEEVETAHAPVRVLRVGIERDDLAEILRRSTIRGRLPEPLRIAHLVATALKTGTSRGSS